MKFHIIIYETPLILATENLNIEVIKLLLSHPSIDVNCLKIILIQLFFMKFHIFQFE